MWVASTISDSLPLEVSSLSGTSTLPLASAMPIEPALRAAAAAVATTGPQATGPLAAESAVPKAAPPQFVAETSVSQATIANMNPAGDDIMQKSSMSASKASGQRTQ